MTSYNRPVKATLYVHLDNGEKFEAKPEDLANFGYVKRLDAYLALDDHLTTVLRDAGMLTADQDLTDAAINPIRYIAELAINHPDLLNHPEVAEVNDEIVAIEQAVLRDRARVPANES